MIAKTTREHDAETEAILDGSRWPLWAQVNHTRASTATTTWKATIQVTGPDAVGANIGRITTLTHADLVMAMRTIAANPDTLNIHPTTAQLIADVVTAKRGVDTDAALMMLDADECDAIVQVAVMGKIHW